MTKDEIKKTLEFCGCDDLSHLCDDCPYDDVRNCTDALKTDALNLIIEQEQEIAQLKDGYARVQEQFAQYQLASDKEIKAQRRQAQIDVLNKVKDIVFDYLGVKNIKEAEALSLLDSTLTYDVVTCGIDELIKEVQNAEDKG